MHCVELTFRSVDAGEGGPLICSQGSRLACAGQHYARTSARRVQHVRDLDQNKSCLTSSFDMCTHPLLHRASDPSCTPMASMQSTLRALGAQVQVCVALSFVLACLVVRRVLIGVDCTGKQASGCACGVLDCLDSRARCRQSCCPGRSMLARRKGRSFTFVCQRVQSLTPQRMGPKMTATGTEEVNRVPRMGRPPGMWVT